MYSYSFRDWPAQAIELPNGDVVVCLIYKTGKEPRFSLREENHNIFRLDRQGNVMWQVKRDEDQWAQWANARERAEAENSKSIWTHSPFMGLVLRYPDGSTNKDLLTGNGPPVAIWTEGAAICCHTLDSRQYELDPESGIARAISMPTSHWW